MDILQDIKFVLLNTLENIYKNKSKLIPISIGILFVYILFSMYSSFTSWILFRTTIFSDNILASRLFYMLINPIFRGLFCALLIGILYLCIEIDRKKFDLEDMKNVMFMFVRDVYYVYFLYFIVSYLIGSIFPNAHIIRILILIFFSAVPEMIYIGGNSREDIITGNINFMKLNGVIWIPIAILTYYIYSNVLNFSIYSYAYNSVEIIKSIIPIVLFSCICIFRAYLFKILYNTTARKRQFMNKF